MKPSRLAALLSCVFCLVVSAEGLAWVVKQAPYGLREATLSGTVKAVDAETATTLKLQCAPGKDGSLSLLYIVSEPKKIPRFPFDDFEGPDAPLAKRKLTSIHVVSPGGKKNFRNDGCRMVRSGFCFRRVSAFREGGYRSRRLRTHSRRGAELDLGNSEPA